MNRTAKNYRWNKVVGGWYVLNIRGAESTVAIEVLRDNNTGPWRIVVKAYRVPEGGTEVGVEYVHESWVTGLAAAKARGIAVAGEWL